MQAKAGYSRSVTTVAPYVLKDSIVCLNVVLDIYILRILFLAEINDNLVIVSIKAPTSAITAVEIFVGP
jgi:hypothetical protein